VRLFWEHAEGSWTARSRLHRLFETQETTAAEWIRHRRLDRCRRDLLDPAQQGCR
jgi:AraC-like DNA-binding protein